MRANLVPLLLLLALTSGWALAEAQTQDPVKVAEFQKRFEEGFALEQQGKLTEARAVYDGILLDEPKAKRSLLEAGKISLKLNEPLKADDYLSKLRVLAPDFPEAIELLIQANQTLKRDVKVELLIKDFRALHEGGTLPDFAKSINFVRERVPVTAGQELVVIEFFDYKQKPNTMWMGKLVDKDGNVLRQFELIFDPEATKELHGKDIKYARAEEFLLVEDVVAAGQITRVDAYYQVFALPEYKKVRNTMLAIVAGAIKPIYSQNITPASQ